MLGRVSMNAKVRLAKIYLLKVKKKETLEKGFKYVQS